MLLDQPEPEAKQIALSLELYTTGSLDIFGKQSNVDLDMEPKDLENATRKEGVFLCSKCESPCFTQRLSIYFSMYVITSERQITLLN